MKRSERMAPEKTPEREETEKYEKDEESLFLTDYSSTDDEEDHSVDEESPHFMGTRLGDAKLTKTYTLLEDLAVALGKLLKKGTVWIQSLISAINLVNNKRHERSFGSIDSRWCRYLHNVKENKIIYRSLNDVINNPEYATLYRILQQNGIALQGIPPPPPQTGGPTITLGPNAISNLHTTTPTTQSPSSTAVTSADTGRRRPTRKIASSSTRGTSSRGRSRRWSPYSSDTSSTTASNNRTSTRAEFSYAGVATTPASTNSQQIDVRYEPQKMDGESGAQSGTSHSMPAASTLNRGSISGFNPAQMSSAGIRSGHSAQPVVHSRAGASPATGTNHTGSRHHMISNYPSASSGNTIASTPNNLHHHPPTVYNAIHGMRYITPDNRIASLPPLQQPANSIASQGTFPARHTPSTAHSAATRMNFGDGPPGLVGGSGLIENDRHASVHRDTAPRQRFAGTGLNRGNQRLPNTSGGMQRPEQNRVLMRGDDNSREIPRHATDDHERAEYKNTRGE